MNRLKQCYFFQIVSLTFIVLLLVACGEQIETNMSEEVAHFEFTNQDNEQVSLTDLEDRWWVANFMYTNCTIICPTTTPNMASVQAEVELADLQAEFISFSIDPDYDTPEVLKAYAEEYDVDLSNWSFLSNYPFEEIQSLSNDSFKTVLEGGGPDEHEFVHSTYFFLVNPEGEIIKKYDGLSQKALQELIEDLKTVLS